MACLLSVATMLSFGRDSFDVLASDKGSSGRMSGTGCYCHGRALDPLYQVS
jgi:hypothetical protein